MSASQASNAHNLALRLCPKLGFHQLQRVLSLVPSVKDLLGLNSVELRSLPLSAVQIDYFANLDWGKVDEMLAYCSQQNIGLVSCLDKGYPELLKQIPQPPIMLFFQGDVTLLESRQIAVVGSRSPSHYGNAMTEQIVSQLAKYPFTITSGLALGVDAIAHRCALLNDMPTIGVLGTGVDVVYPKSNRNLNQEVAEKGLLVSEFLPKQPPVKHHFPKRNRIIAGLSKGTLVVEAAIKSGSLITAYQALEQDRDVFAVPGSVFNPLSEGTNHLIQQGAKPVTCAADIVEEYLTLPIQQQVTKNHLAESKLLASVDHDTTPVDVIVQRSDLPMDQVLKELLDLEVQGVVMAVPGGYVKVANQL